MSTTTEDRIVVLGKQADALIRKARTAQTTKAACVRHGDVVGATNAEHADDRYYDMLNAIERTILNEPASSLQGALIQALIVASLIDPLTNGDFLSPAERDATGRRLYQAVVSIIGVLERETGFTREDLGSSFYLLPEVDPFKEYPAAAGEL